MPNDVLGYGLSAGGNTSGFGAFGAPSWLGMYNYGPGGTGVRKSPTGAAGAGLKFNLGSATDIKNISDLINSINLAATKTANQSRIPNELALETKSSANIADELKGDVPQDVKNLLAQQAAERGIGGGGDTTSPNANAAYLRALGLTSLNEMDVGQKNLTAATNRNPAAPITDPSKFTLTPAQMAQLELEYKTEADRAAEEERRLALSRGGGGGGRGGFGYYGGGGGGGGSPYEYGEPGVYSYGAPTTTTTTGPTVGSTIPFNWQQSLGNYIPAGDTAGTFYAGPNTNQVTDYYDYSAGANQGTV